MGEELPRPESRESGKSLPAQAGELRALKEDVDFMTSPLEELGRDLVDVAFRKTCAPIAMLEMIEEETGLEIQTEHFSATDYTHGIILSLANIPGAIGMSAANTAYMITAHGPAAWDVILGDVGEYADDFDDASARSKARIGYLMEDFLDYSHHSNYEDTSFLMGRLVGIILGVLLMRKVTGSLKASGSTKTATAVKALSLNAVANKGTKAAYPEYTAVKYLAVINLTGEMAEELLPEGADQPSSPQSRMAAKLLERLQMKMEWAEDPILLHAYAEALDDLYLNSKDPERFPIPKETLDFLRGQFVEEYRTLMVRHEITADNFELAMRALLWMSEDRAPELIAHLDDDQTRILLLYEEGAEEILADLKLDKTERNGLRIALRGVRSDLDAGSAPNPMFVDRVVTIFNSVYLRGELPEQGEDKPKISGDSIALVSEGPSEEA